MIILHLPRHLKISISEFPLKLNDDNHDVIMIAQRIIALIAISKMVSPFETL